ncbi:metabolite traffic protein EboE [Actinoplanes sp. RD1]|uniref:metabolite traffic protein EboE n=1 Tax=Actinoplanes sp. RD1 TaxID=3064538 RepID=UPI0027405CE2|nr:metabolite traffic protein EboE [Actinoplanes sp. RD1]
MRLADATGRQRHLSYCTNVHEAEDLDGILRQLDTYAVPVRERLGTDVLGLGLWLPAPVAAGLASDVAARQGLRNALTSRGLEVVTLNGFPYQAFHAPVVKHAVYQPDWTTPQRMAYTVNLGVILADLLPDDAAYGSISSLPLAWRDPWDAARAAACRRALVELAAELHRLPRRIRVAFEPEPGCIVETTQEAVALLGEADTSVLGVCLDLAHLACAWEEPPAALARLREAGLPVVKTQLSAALASADPHADRAVLGEYAEPRFLHQTRGPHGFKADDLDEALDARGADAQPWRVHFHVPLHQAPAPPLTSTVGVLVEALGALVELSDCAHFDVETYTWGVLPPTARPRDPAELAAGIASELFFARAQLTALGLTPLPGVPS